MSDLDKSKELALHVRDAISRKYELNIIGGDSKRFYGGDIKGESISIAEHSGVINYQPNELVISARAGTPLKEIESVLAEKKQRLLFEPPHYGNTATIGGTVAANMNGPTRPWTGGVKDAVLGVKIINGNGEVLRFGGEVMKNVAGYDVSRLMVGSMGTLGILLEVSMKVLPLENKTITLMYELTEEKDATEAAEREALPGVRRPRGGADPQGPDPRGRARQGALHQRLQGRREDLHDVRPRRGPRRRQQRGRARCESAEGEGRCGVPSFCVCAGLRRCGSSRARCWARTW